MKRRVMGGLAGWMLLLSACAQADTAADAEALARRMAAGEYAAVAAQFDDVMRAAVDEAALAAGFEGVTAQLGACTGVAAVQADDAARTAAVQMTHANGASVLSVAFDEAGQIASLYIAPQRAPVQAAARAMPEGVTAQAVTIPVDGGAYPLAGELLVPKDADGRTAYVVFAHGSGPSDMDETVGGCKPFRDLAYDLAALGVGSLRFDKITYSHPLRPVETVDQEYLEPLREAVGVLREQAGDARIYLVGHSEGGMLAPYLVEQCGLDGGVSLAGTPLTLWEISMAQNLAVIEALPEAQRAPLLAQVEEERAKGLRLTAMSDEEAARETVFGVSAVYQRHMARIDEAEIARRCGRPFLFLWGEADFQVDRAAFEAWRARLGDDARFAYRSYPGLSHLMTPAGEGDSIQNAQAAYETPQTVAPQVAGDIAAWIAAH